MAKSNFPYTVRKKTKLIACPKCKGTGITIGEKKYRVHCSVCYGRCKVKELTAKSYNLRQEYLKRRKEGI